MARQYGESFQRPTDPFTGEPIPGAPAVAVINNTRPSGPGFVVLRDDFPQLPVPPSGPGGPWDPAGN